VRRPFRTALVGVGRMGATYADDPLIPASLSLCLATHKYWQTFQPPLPWEAVVDSNHASFGPGSKAAGAWRKSAASHFRNWLSSYDPEVSRAGYYGTAQGFMAEVCPKLKGVLLRKALKRESRRCLGVCPISVGRAGFLLQVNLCVRCDPFSRRLAEEKLTALIR